MIPTNEIAGYIYSRSLRNATYTVNFSISVFACRAKMLTKTVEAKNLP
jgi:hypothetical protein